MRAADGLRRSGIAISPDRSVQDAAEVMEQTGVGALAIVDGAKLVGVVTDRDIVRRCIARRRPADVRVDSIMSTPVVTLDADADIHSAFSLFRAHALRRLAIVREGAFLGMVTVDDLLIDVAGDLADLARPVTAEVVFGQRDSQAPATTP
jgi:CBS domain-containing protein